jgi:uncharacterized protein (DUF1697 family)
MTSYVALLRGVNLGGHKMVAMAELRKMLAGLGFDEVRTLLQSGNAVFRARATAAARLEQQLESATAAHFGLTCDYHVRTAAEWRAVIAANPMPKEAAKDPSRFTVTFFKSPLDPAVVKKAQAAIEGPEILRADGRHLYMYWPDGQGTSKAGAAIGKVLKVHGTARNWNTVLKLAALVAD